MLSEQNIEAELSYAYLHAVASRGGFACECSGRHSDSAGVDATVQEDGRQLADESILTTIRLDVQLKATYQQPTEVQGHYAYNRLTVGQYNKLRCDRLQNPRILVVLYLPTDASEWLRHTEDALIAKRCAYWVSLRGAPVSSNAEYQTVYLPKTQALSVSTLHNIMTHISLGEVLTYAG